MKWGNLVCSAFEKGVNIMSSKVQLEYSFAGFCVNSAILCRAGVAVHYLSDHILGMVGRGKRDPGSATVVIPCNKCYHKPNYLLKILVSRSASHYKAITDAGDVLYSTESLLKGRLSKLFVITRRSTFSIGRVPTWNKIQ